MFFDESGCVVELLVRSSCRPVGVRSALLFDLGRVWACRGRAGWAVSAYGVGMVGARWTAPSDSKLGLTAVIRNRPLPASSYLAAQM
jgi:hypothetical protein